MSKAKRVFAWLWLTIVGLIILVLLIKSMIAQWPVYLYIFAVLAFSGVTFWSATEAGKK